LNNIDFYGEFTLKKVILSAVMITGTCRKRAQKALDALYEQTIIDQIEIIVADLGAKDCPPFISAPNIRISIIPMPKNTSWASARMAAVQRATGEIIAFIEDHSFARSDWAEHVVRTFEGPWAAVGYSVVNANPTTYISRGGVMADYILWMSPVHNGKTELLPGNNVSYRRDLLTQFGDRLKNDLGIDFNIHEELQRQGYEFAMSTKAQIAHQNYDRLSGLIQANYHYSKMLAANRISLHNWGLFKQVVYVVATPFGSPFIRIMRIIKSLRGRQPLVRPFISALPVIFITFFCSAVAESLGYLLGAGQSAEDFNKWELMQERTKNQ
jgi:glycosyltransferase involved in cell wall biosynthesis